MKKIIINLIMIFSCMSLLAQKKKEQYRLLPSFPITVDGSLAEWGDQLFMMDPDSSWGFAISNDAHFIYVAVQVKDPILQQDATRHGILININKEAKKKDAAQLLFPVPDAETLRAMANDDNLPNLNVREELIKRSRGYQVKGFDQIVDGLLSFENTYEVHAVAKLLPNDRLVYEAKIPLESVAIKDIQKDIAIQIMINNRFAQLQKLMKNRPNTRQSVYGRTYNSSPSLKNPYKVKTDIWWVGKLNE